MTNKVTVTADAVLQIVKSIFKDSDVDVKIPEWDGRTITDVLNVEYYTFKHRPASSLNVLSSIFEKAQGNKLEPLTKSFCLLSLGKVERLFSKDEDTGAVNATLEYYIQSDKVKLLETLIDNSSAAVSGQRLNLKFRTIGEDEMRSCVVFFGSLRETDVLQSTPFGEMIGLEVNVTLMYFEAVTSYSDYDVSFTFVKDGAQKGCSVPLKSLSIANTMTQKSLPSIRNVHKVSNVNLSAANSFVLVFDGYKDNDFIDYVTDWSLSGDVDNNNPELLMTLKRGEATYTHLVIVKDHQITVNADTGNESHTLTLVRFDELNRSGIIISDDAGESGR